MAAPRYGETCVVKACITSARRFSSASSVSCSISAVSLALLTCAAAASFVAVKDTTACARIAAQVCFNEEQALERTLHLVLQLCNVLVDFACMLVQLIAEEALDLSFQPGLLRGMQPVTPWPSVTSARHDLLARAAMLSSRSSRLAAYEHWMLTNYDRDCEQHAARRTRRPWSPSGSSSVRWPPEPCSSLASPWLKAAALPELLAGVLLWGVAVVAKGDTCVVMLTMLVNEVDKLLCDYTLL